jgi:di/tricarboxylate transporter
VSQDIAAGMPKVWNTTLVKRRWRNSTNSLSNTGHLQNDNPGLQALKRDRFFHLLLIIGAGLSVFVPFAPHTWPAAIDWRTIITLSGLMMLTKGVELSGYFDVLGRKMVRRFATERKLALFMVLSAAVLSTFLTNDVALFIVVPLTLTLRKLCEIPVSRLIIFEALAVNAGSLLTPIGNPQNILLWGRSGLSFAAFTWQMMPLALVMMVSLLVVCWFAFPDKRLQYHSGTTGPEWKPRLVWSCLALYIVFLTALEMKQELAGVGLVACGFLILARRVLVSVDWTLLLVFMAMFIDVHLLIQLPVLQHAAQCQWPVTGRSVAHGNRFVAVYQQCSFNHFAP